MNSSTVSLSLNCGEGKEEQEMGGKDGSPLVGTVREACRVTAPSMLHKYTA